MERNDVTACMHDWIAYDDPADPTQPKEDFNVECIKCGARGWMNAARVIVKYSAGRLDDVQ